jgi:hypothetical protein
MYNMLPYLNLEIQVNKRDSFFPPRLGQSVIKTSTPIIA